MKIKSLFLFIFLIKVCIGQDTTYFDAKWEKTTLNKASYYRIEQKDGANWVRSDYYVKTHQLQMKGTYSSISPDIRNGYFEWYHENGKLKHKGNYKNDKQVGEHLWYGENGNLEAKELYKDGKLNGIIEEYHPNGKLMDKSTYVDGLQSGLTTYWREDGIKKSEGNYKNGNRNGEWTFYDANGKVEGKKVYKIDYEIKEAKLFIQLPNDNWALEDKSGKERVQYVFARDEIKDSTGRAIAPAIILSIEDATSFNKDLVLYSTEKRMAFAGKNIKVDKVLIHLDKDYPISINNSMWIRASYEDKGLDHILYMVYVITKDNKGIQLYMDMTKSIADEYEKEFLVTLQSLKEL